MKVAFLGKGGSGKSTISSIFIRHLAEQNQHVLAVDADINQNLSALIGAEFCSELALSGEDNKKDIRTTLIGNNTRIARSGTMIKTTPPGAGSHLIEISKTDPIVKKYATTFAPDAYFMHVGTYEDDGIGISCYHTSLSIFENILSHTPAMANNEWLVADMVAGTDAFSGPLHAMFDLLFVVVEPSAESVGVFRQFIKLAQASGMADRVRIIANKVEDDEDITFIKEQTNYQPFVSFKYDSTVRRQRQRGESINISQEWRNISDHIMKEATLNQKSPDAHLRTLHDLHTTFASQNFTIKKYGDTLGHIDPEFSLEGVEKS